MKYPKEVQEKIKILDQYKESNTLNEFNILHLYPKELAYPNGFYDSRFFELIGFNTFTMQKRNLGKHDAIEFQDGCTVYIVRVFADGAYLIQFKGLVKFDMMLQKIYMKTI